MKRGYEENMYQNKNLENSTANLNFKWKFSNFPLGSRKQQLIINFKKSWDIFRKMKIGYE